MEKIEDKIIDYALEKFNIHDYTECPYDEILDYFSLKREDYFLIKNNLKLAETHGLIIFSGNTNYSAKLTLKGKQILENGGWIKHLENETKKLNIINEKDKYDLLTKKWIYRTRALPYIVSILSLLLSIAVYYTNTRRENEINIMKKEIKQLKAKDSINLIKKPNG